ncbi:MAG: hypothetical protein IPO66_14170 [Rhodanobacteraceae bacterium]|nr:hypothetical protein [Rhodanobacteraceae bacterium]
MARAIAGGLLFSTVITLVVLPTVYAAIEDAGERFKASWRRAGGAPSAAPSAVVVEA